MNKYKKGSVLAYTLVILVVISIIASIVFIAVTRTVQINERNSKNNLKRIVLRQAVYEIIEDLEKGNPVSISNTSHVVYDLEESNTIKVGFEEDNYLIIVTYNIEGGIYKISTWKDEVKWENY